MIKRWIQRKIQLKSIQSARIDIERFIDVLRGYDAQELGMLVAYATVIRINLQTYDKVKPIVFDISCDSKTQIEAQLFLSKLIRVFQQKGNLPDAAGAMVWLHTLRCFTYPELRFLGRELWSYLSKGFPLTVTALQELEICSPKPIPPHAYYEFDFVPAGLEIES